MMRGANGKGVMMAIPMVTTAHYLRRRRRRRRQGEAKVMCGKIGHGRDAADDGDDDDVDEDRQR